MTEPVTKNTNAEAPINIGLVVSNFDASINFYMKVFEMQLITSFPITAEQSKSSGFADGNPFTIHLLETVNKKNANSLKLISFANPPAKRTAGGIDQNAGVNYITFNFDSHSYKAVLQRLKEAEINLLGSIDSPYFKAAYIQDPNGVFVEILHTIPQNPS